MYLHKLTAQVHDTDAAGVIYFANFYRMAHSAYEEFMESIGFSIRYFLDEAEVVQLIVHYEADYKISVRTGDKLRVELKIEKVGSSSYVLSYNIFNDKNEIAAALKTVHVSVDKEKRTKVPLPEKFKETLLEFLKTA